MMCKNLRSSRITIPTSQDRPGNLPIGSPLDAICAARPILRRGCYRAVRNDGWLILLVAVALVLSLLARIARAQQLPENTAENRMVTALCLLGEVDYHVEDRAPIAYILAARYAIARRELGWTYYRTVQAYCHVLHGRTQRSRDLALMPGGPLYSRSKWRELTRWVDRWFAGEIPNTCPEAKHWGSAKGENRTGMARVNCPGTVSRFYGDAK